MSEQPALPGFDYGELSQDAREIVQMERDFIRDRMKRTARDIIAIGTSLNEIKEALPHGQFIPWLNAEFPGWSRDSANNYMRVARLFPEMTNNSSFDPTALYALAAGGVSDDIREEFIERAEAGERITHAMVREALRPEPVHVPAADPIRLEIVDRETGEIVSMPTPQPAPLPDPLRERLEDWAERNTLRMPTPEEKLAANFPAYVNEMTRLDPEAVARAMLALDRNALELCVRAIPRLGVWLDDLAGPVAAADTSARFRIVQ